MNNSVFGKTMENVRRRRPVKLVTEWDGRSGAEALIARPNFHSCTIFDTNLVALELGCTDLLLNKPIYAGFCVLNISKTLVYNFHYDIMHRIVNPNYVQLMYTDTDSLVYDVTHTDMYEVMKQNPQYFDTSDYPENNRFGLPLLNKKGHWTHERRMCRQKDDRICGTPFQNVFGPSGRQRCSEKV